MMNAFFGLRGLVCVYALLLPHATPWAADAGKAQSYAITLPVVVAPTEPLQRLLLPAGVLVKLQSAGYSDLRLFNAQGQAIPMALTTLAPANQTENRQVLLVAAPILGSAIVTAGVAGAIIGNDGVSLRIEERQGRRMVYLNTASASVPGATPTQAVLGALLDARAVSAPVVAMALDVDLPKAQPITFKVDASKDLKSWRRLADTVLYRPDGVSPAIESGNSKLELAFADIKDHYLRVTWADAAGQLAPVILRSASLTTARTTSSNPRVTATLALAASALASPHELIFSLGFATPVAALKIRLKGLNELVPMRVLGRNASGQPWTPLASTVLYSLQLDGKEQSNGALELPGAAYREIKIEADKKTPGFTSLPEITLQFEPVQVVFLASGQPPFTLAVGLADLASAYLPIQSLMPGYQNAQENTLALAQIEAVAVAAAPLIQAQTASDAMPGRSLVLWAVLMAGVLALALMAWALLKQDSKPSAQGADTGQGSV